LSRVRQRVTVSDAEVVIQPTPDEVDSFASKRFGELVRELPGTAADRATGRRRFEVVVDGWRFEATAEDARRAELRDRALRAAAEHQAATDVTLRAQIPGRVAHLWVVDGEAVEEGQRLLAIEAMKMENEIRAPHAGMVRNVRVELGTRVERNDELLTVGE
jgi:biotin carboxyl carrier protein